MRSKYNKYEGFMKKILFIGNSFTFFNDMPNSIFKKICDASDISASIKAITCGGYRLCQFADPENEYGKQVYRAFETDKFHIVILQEQSRAPVIEFDSFFCGAESLVALAKNNGCDIYFYQTWGYKEGHNLLSVCGGTTAIMASKLKNSYYKVAEALNVLVSPVGDAFLDIHSNSNINLYAPDLFHPSLEGSTLAALVLFSSIFKKEVTKINFDSNLEENVLHQLKKASEKILKNNFQQSI